MAIYVNGPSEAWQGGGVVSGLVVPVSSDRLVAGARPCSKDSQAESRLVKKCVMTAEQGLPWAQGGGASGKGGGAMFLLQ